MRRTPRILYRLLMGDMLRLLAVTTVVLVVVIAFAGTIKPLADGSLTPGQALLFMSLLLVPMIQFALPFAAGFSATLTYHRFAADNEAMAASVAGLGHRALLLPALVLGVSLSVLLSVMSFEIIPPMLRQAQSVLFTDGTRVLATQLNRGDAVRLSFGGSEAIDLYADRALPPETPEPGSDAASRGATSIVTLEGVLAVEARPGGEPVYASAERVFLLVFRGGREDTSVQLVFENATGNLLDGQEGFATRLVTRRLRLPSRLSDDPKFLTWGGMREAGARPRSMSKVDRAARVLAARLGEREAERLLDLRLADTGGARLVLSSSFRENETLTLDIESPALIYDPAVDELDPDMAPERAERVAQRERLDRWRLTLPVGATRHRVVRTSPDGSTITHLAERVWLELPLENPGRSEAVARFSLRLEGVVTLDGAPQRPFQLTGSEPARPDLVYDDLLPEGFDPGALAERPLEQLFERAKDAALREHELTPRIRTVRRDLEDRVDEQEREIMSKRHERLGFAVACCVMVLTGAGLGMDLRDRLPLPVYLWSFLPALACIITISAGQRLVHREGSIGLVLLWGGVVALAALFVRVYGRLRRH